MAARLHPLARRPHVSARHQRGITMIVALVFLVIMMIVAALLTSMTVAREWERGTMEQLISTPVKPTPCDRSTGDIAGRGTVSLTAGPLVLGNVSVLGEVGDVLILANSEDRLFYFVCRSTIGFIG